MPLRIAALVFLCACALLTRAQDPLAWRGFAPGFTNSQTAVDADGSIFWVGADSFGGNYSIHVIKYSPTGVRLADASRWLATGSNAKTLAPSFAGGRIYVGLTSADGSGIMALETGDLTMAWFDVMDGVEVQAIHATATQVVTLEDNGTTRTARRRAAATGNNLGSTTLASLTELDQSAMDGSGHVYVAGPGTTRSVSRLIRVNAAGSLHYDLSLSFPGYAARTARTMNVYGSLVMVGYDGTLVNGGSNVLLYRGKLSDGSGSAWTINADDFDSLKAVLPQADGSAIIALQFFGSGEGDRILRRSAAGVSWSIDLFNQSLYFLLADQDASGNILIGRRDTQQSWMDTVIERRDPSTGALLWEHVITGVSSLPTDLDVTPTGNVLLSSAEDLYVLQGLLVGFDRTSVIGGNSVLLQVLLTRPTPVANLPVLLFSNAVELPVPTSVNLPLGSTGTTVPINTLGVTSTKVATVNVRHVGYITQKAVTLLPPLLSTLVVSPVQVTGGTSTQGTVTIAGDAPTGGWLVNLSSGNAAASVPSTVTIPATLSTAPFVISTNPVSANTGIVISATRNSVTRTAFMAVNAPALSTFTLGSSSVVGGQNGSLTVTLNALAPTGGYSISLISGAPGLVVLPSSTAVPVGTNTRNLSFATTDVTSTINVTLVAHRGPVLRTQTLTLTP
ncbi:MAG: hypothetical protein IT363_00465 [Methanoregulaceae archaeon]|nr:hypothetical protein [Methanoregulaceae archaeon]